MLKCAAACAHARSSRIQGGGEGQQVKAAAAAAAAARDAMAATRLKLMISPARAYGGRGSQGGSPTESTGLAIYTFPVLNVHHSIIARHMSLFCCLQHVPIITASSSSSSSAAAAGIVGIAMCEYHPIHAMQLQFQLPAFPPTCVHHPACPCCRP